MIKSNSDYDDDRVMIQTESFKIHYSELDKDDMGKMCHVCKVAKSKEYAIASGDTQTAYLRVCKVCSKQLSTQFERTYVEFLDFMRNVKYDQTTHKDLSVPRIAHIAKTHGLKHRGDKA